MKKVALFVAACMLVTPVVVHAECRNGVEFTGRDGTSRYCKSNITMNWWSAFAWCQAQGHDLATFEQACPDATSLILSQGICGNITNNTPHNELWIARAWNTEFALATNGGGCSDICRASFGSFSRKAQKKALCIEH